MYAVFALFFGTLLCGGVIIVGLISLGPCFNGFGNSIKDDCMDKYIFWLGKM
jgi:hypothetical protein